MVDVLTVDAGYQGEILSMSERFWLFWGQKNVFNEVLPDGVFL